VAQDVDGWIANTNGCAGWWSYAVIDTLCPGPETTGTKLALGVIEPMVLTNGQNFRKLWM
jgi:hypothetical protein